jgi:hypothetical protein
VDPAGRLEGEGGHAPDDQQCDPDDDPDVHCGARSSLTLTARLRLLEQY